jgi:hypothetical protein
VIAARQRQRRRRALQPSAELEYVAHLEPVHHDVDRSLACLVDEVRLLLAEQRVVAPVGRVALCFEQAVDARAVLRAGREVEVGVGASRASRPRGTVRADGHAAQEAHDESLVLSHVHDPQALRQRILERPRDARSRLSRHAHPQRVARRPRRVAGEYRVADSRSVDPERRAGGVVKRASVSRRAVSGP